jgi:cytidyltransferase-like protein
MEKIVLVTGGFDPLHSGHVNYFKHARQLGDKLIVGVNSDAWLSRKKGRPFMPYMERASIIRHLNMVDFVIDFNDNDNTAKHAIQMVRQSYPQAEILFANGGDRTDKNIPEMDVVDNNLKFVFGVGGFDKANSSSWILEEWKAPKTERPWGYYRVLHELPGTKVKELTVMPGQSLSMQKHKHRAEYWFVAEGACQVKRDLSDMQVFKHDEMIKISVGDWHQLSNPFDQPCKLVEIQYGDSCIEEDIERK